MQGRKSQVLVMLLLVVVGCQGEPAPVAPPSASPTELADLFDPGNTGVIAGAVTWTGPPPAPPPFEVHAYLDALNAGRLRGAHANPHAPVIEAASRGIRDVLIRLYNVDPARSKPWAYEPVTIEMQDDRLLVCQGDERRRIGIVRRGTEVAFVRRDADFHLVRARGSAFFTLPFAAAEQPSSRRLEKAGLVELFEGAGCYWRRAHLAVMDHPYVVITDRSGRFTLDGVPAGTYRLSAWLPNWNVERHEHEPETAIISRINFAPAVELEQSVTVAAGNTTTANFSFALGQFNKGR